MVRKTIPTTSTQDTRKFIVDKSSNPTLAGLARSIVDIQKRGGQVSIAMVHAKHVEMLIPYHDELAKILSIPIVVVTNLSMLETVYRWGIEFTCRISDQN